MINFIKHNGVDVIFVGCILLFIFIFIFSIHKYTLDNKVVTVTDKNNSLKIAQELSEDELLLKISIMINNSEKRSVYIGDGAGFGLIKKNESTINRVVDILKEKGYIVDLNYHDYDKEYNMKISW